MSDLLRARNAILVALGIPAASITTSSCAAESKPPVVRRPDPTNVQLAAGCVDPGWVCSYDERGCGPDASDQESSTYTGELRGQKWLGGSPETLKSMRFDRARTDKARAEAFPGQVPANYCCYSGCPTYAEAPATSAVRAPGDIIRCVPFPERTEYPAEPGSKCPASIAIEGTFRAFLRFEEKEGTCCYETGMHHGNLGRPLRLDGAVTDVESREGAPERLGLVGIDPRHYRSEERARMASEWHDAALAEHASVAAFAKISLELLAFGAPSDLVREAHEAAIDELRHAALASEIANAFGARVVPGPHPAAARVAPHTELAAFIAETIEDGCIGEAQAALEASRAAARTRDPALACAYLTIAADEERHAALAWKILQWALSVDPGLEDILVATLAKLEPREDVGETVRSIAIPCAAALLASFSGAAPRLA